MASFHSYSSGETWLLDCSPRGCVMEPFFLCFPFPYFFSFIFFSSCFLSFNFFLSFSFSFLFSLSFLSCREWSSEWASWVIPLPRPLRVPGSASECQFGALLPRSVSRSGRGRGVGVLLLVCFFVCLFLYSFVGLFEALVRRLFVSIYLKLLSRVVSCWFLFFTSFSEDFSFLLYLKYL